MMRFAVSLFVIALGAILTFGIKHNPSGVDIHAIGLILMLVGVAGLAIGYHLYRTRRRTDIIYTDSGETVIEPNIPRPEDPIDPLA
jgi:xanthosine utilization system XapX-like protein